jgi:hypothetical protein
VPGNVERWRALVRRHTPEDLRGDPGFERIVLATIAAESGGDPQAVGDRGASVGLFQLHERGLGSGLTRAQRADPDTNASRAVPQLAEAYRRTGGDPARTYVLAINPGARPDGPEVSRVMDAYGRSGGGGKVMASVQEQGVGDEDIFDQVVKAKGKWVGVEQVGARTTKKKTKDRYGEETEEDVPVQNPTYRYVFKDGTHLDARKTEDGSYEVTGGTALTSLAREQTAEQKAQQKAAAAPPKTITVGGRSYTWNADTDTFEPSPGVTQPTEKPSAAEKPVMVGGRPYRWVPNYPGDTQGHLEEIPGTDETAKEKPEEFTLGRARFRVGPDGVPVKIAEVPRETPERAPRYPEEEEQAGLNLIRTRQQIAAGERDLMPLRQRILQGHQETVKYVQGMLERGEIEPAEADAYVTASLQAAQSALRGTTPYDEAQAKRKAELDRQQMGKDILNQRLSSGTSLASSLLSSATNLAGKAIFRPGQTSLGVDPLASLMPTLDQLQGGPEVTPYAKGLLLGAGPQGPTGPVIGTTPSGVPVYDPGTSGMRGGLPPQPMPAGL